MHAFYNLSIVVKDAGLIFLWWVYNVCESYMHGIRLFICVFLLGRLDIFMFARRFMTCRVRKKFDYLSVICVNFY